MHDRSCVHCNGKGYQQESVSWVTVGDSVELTDDKGFFGRIFITEGRNNSFINRILLKFRPKFNVTMRFRCEG